MEVAATTAVDDATAQTRRIRLLITVTLYPISCETIERHDSYGVGVFKEIEMADRLQTFIDFMAGKPTQILIVIVASLIARALIVRGIERVANRAIKLNKERANRDDRAPETPEQHIEQMRREQRARSISQLLRSTITVFLWAIAAVTVMSILGINIGPIVASAGVVGVALGFGAQTLVKDYLAGIFSILEDQFGIGDLVDVGPVVGIVEEVGLRVTRLRDLSGVVWYVRNGEILRVANRSQGWTMAVVDVPVSYDSDLELVKSIVEKVADEMSQDNACAELIIDRPEYAGVESVSGEAVVIRVTARALPDNQVAASREIRERMKNALDSAGVTVPVVLRIPGQTPPKV